MVVDERHIGGITDFLFELDGGQLVDGIIGISELELSECLPEHVEGVVGLSVPLLAGVLERLPELLPDQEEHRALSDLQLHLLILRHSNRYSNYHTISQAIPFCLITGWEISKMEAQLYRKGPKKMSEETVLILHPWLIGLY